MQLSLVGSTFLRLAGDGVPVPLEKLMAKTPEERYRTATGLEADLQRCRDGLARGE